jgi:hypothetical protein
MPKFFKLIILLNVRKTYTLLLLMLGINLISIAQRPARTKPQSAKGDSTTGHRPRGFDKSRRAFFENLSPEERKKLETMSVSERRNYLHSKGFGRPRGN